MLFYIGLFIISVGLALFSKKEIFVVIAFVLLGAAFALRDSLGVDDNTYINAFNQINMGWDYDIEFTYQWLAVFINQYLGMNYKAIFLIYGTLSIMFLYKGVKIICKSNFQKALFLASFFGIIFVTSMSVMRQFLAACIVFYAISSYIKQKSSKKTLLLIIFASCFHYTAAIAIPVFFMMRSKWSIPNVIKMIIPLVFVFLGALKLPSLIINQFIFMLPLSYQHYADSLMGSFSSAGGTMHYILLLIFICQYFWKMERNTPVESQRIEILEFGQMIYLSLNFLFAQAGVASRLSFTFMPFIATLPYTFLMRFRSKDKKFIGVICILCMFALYLITLNGFASSGSEFFIPYRWSLDFWE